MSASMRILDIPGRPGAKLVAEFAKMVTPHLSDSMERLYAGGDANTKVEKVAGGVQFTEGLVWHPMGS